MSRESVDVAPDIGLRGSDCSPIHSPTSPRMTRPRFDRYAATVPGVAVDLLFELVINAGDGVRVGKNLRLRKREYYRNIATFWDDRGPIAEVRWGGPNPDPHLDVWGPQTESVAVALRERYPHHPTRIDSCLDTEDPGAFASLKAVLLAFAESYPRDLKIKNMETLWKNECAKTSYLGSDASDVQLKLYEKGKTPEYEEYPHLVRVELKVMAKNLDEARKARLSSISATELWGMSAWSKAVAALVFGADVEKCVGASKYRAKSTVLQKASNLCKQYGNSFDDFVKYCGSVDNLGRWLVDMRAQIVGTKRTNNIPSN